MNYKVEPTDLSVSEIMEIKKYDYPEDYVVGGSVDNERKELTLYRGDFSKLVVPFDYFKPNPINKPEFNN